VVGVSGGTADPVGLEDVEVIRLPHPRVATKLRAAGFGGPGRTGAMRRELQGLLRLGRLALLTVRLARAGRTAGEFDVVHAHDLDALPAGAFLARCNGARLVYDAHELYTDVDIAPPRLTRALMRAVERRFARRADAVVTVGEDIAAELQRILRLPARPSVVRNVPYLVDLPAPVANEGRLRVVYQAGNDHPIRPIDLVVEAAALAPEIDLTIRVLNLDAKQRAREVDARGLGGRVRIAPPVEPNAMIPQLAPFDIGLVVQLPLNENARLGLPNKLFEYLMAGLAVVVPDGGAMADLVRAEDVGVTYDASSADSLAAAFGRLADDRGLVARLRANAAHAAHARYHAEREEETLAKAWGVATADL
jgi:glycogen synthase